MDSTENFFESERRFSDMAANSSGVVFQFYAREDGSTGFYYISPKANEIFGLSIDPNSSDWDLGNRIHPDEKQAFITAVTQSIAEFKDLNFEGRLITPLGEKWFQCLSKPMRKKDEIIFNGIMIDITERKEIEKTTTFLLSLGFKGSGEDFFKNIASYLAQCLHMEYICIDQLEGDGLTAKTLAVYNEGTFDINISYALKDTPCGDVVGKNICCYPSNVCNLFPLDLALQELKAESYIGTTLWSYDGKAIGLIAAIGQKPLLNIVFAETILKMVGIRVASELERIKTEQDLIKAKELAEELLEETQKQTAEKELQNERLESLLRIAQYKPLSNQDLLDYSLQEAIILTSSKIGYIYYYSEEKRQFTLNTWSKEVMKECTVLNPQTVYDLDKTGCWGETVRQRKPIVINNYAEENIYKKGIPHGHVALTKFLSIPVFINNTIVAVVGVGNKEKDYDQSDIRQLTLLMDNVWRIADRERIIDELKTSKEKAEESDRLKSAFLANMSHEIRTPMNGILGFSDLLKNMNLSGEKQQEYIQMIEMSGIRLLGIINDIIDISKIEAGQMQLMLSETNINEQTEYIYRFFKPETDAKGIKLSIRNSLASFEANINTDREKVYAVLTNLVKNAIKFTQQGSIELGYEKKNDVLEFFVKDTGKGIRKEHQDLVFERFRQSSESYTRNFEGAGLGLSISKAYVEMLGGKIWVESTVDKGSCFYFTLPYNATSEISTIDTPSAPNKSKQNLKNLKILIAEDDEFSGKIISLYLKDISREILKVKTGNEAVEACRNNPDIDLVLMDIRMDEMNGYEATKKIRTFNDKLIIIAQTAYAFSGEQEKSREAGCNDFISKPINHDSLILLLQKYF